MRLTAVKAALESGSVLVVCLLLLGMLSLLAVAGMQTSALDLSMAGNEQYRARAFEAAQAGIERIIAAGKFDASVAESVVEELLADGDRYSAVIRPRGSGHFEIQSTGFAPRDARFTAVQALFVLEPGSTVARTYWYSKDER